MDNSIFMALTGIIFITFPSISAQGIANAPQNVAQYVDETVELMCEFHTNTVSDLEWSICLTGPSACTLLFRNDQIVPGATPPAHYRVENRTESAGKRYDLIISGVKTTDAAQFRCAAPVLTDYEYAEVIALVSDMYCSSNLTSGEVELGQFIYLISQVPSYGEWLPVSIFRLQNGTLLSGPVDESSGTTARYSVMFQADKGLQGQSVSAEWFFNDVTGTAVDEASNTPSFPTPDTCSFQPIIVNWPPENVAIESGNGKFHEGETITCAVHDGHPTPNLKWINMNDTSDVTDCGTSSSCQLTVPAGMIGETLVYQCQACNTYFSQIHCDSDKITFTTYDGYNLSPGGVAGIVVGYIILLISNSVILIICLRRGTTTKEKPTSSEIHGVPLYQNMTLSNGSNSEPGTRSNNQNEAPGSAPYEELGSLREPTRPSEYDAIQPTETPAMNFGRSPHYVNA